MKKNVEEIGEIKDEIGEIKKVFSNLADSLGKSKKDILDLLERHGAKSDEKLLRQAEGFLEEEIQQGKLSQELKNEILDLLKEGVNGKSGTIIGIKDKDSIKKVIEEKGLDLNSYIKSLHQKQAKNKNEEAEKLAINKNEEEFHKLWDSYIKYLRQKQAKNKNEEAENLAIKKNEEAEDFLEEEVQKGKLSQELKNEILDLLKEGVNGKSGTIIGIKDNIRNGMEKKGLNFDEFWDSYIKHLRQKLAINKNEEFDELWNSYIKYLRQKQAIKKDEEAEGFLEEEQKKVEEELKNEILHLLKKGVNGKTGTIIDIKDSIREVMEEKGLNFDEFWDLYIKYLYNKWLVIIRNEEKVKKSVSKLKEILESHENFDGKTVIEGPKTMTVTEGLKRKKLIERSLRAGFFKGILFSGSKLGSIYFKNGLPISNKMFRETIRTNIPIVLFDGKLKKKLDKLLKYNSKKVDSKYKSLVDKVIERIEDEILKSEPNNGLVYFEKKFGGFIYREIDKNSDKIYCRVPIKSFKSKDLQFSIGKVDAYIVYEKGQNGDWTGSLTMDDCYDFPERGSQGTGVKGFLNKKGRSHQDNGRITPYHWRISYKMPTKIIKDGVIKTDYSAVA